MSPQHKPKVVHIIDEMPPDGAERLIVDVLSKRSMNFDFQVLCLVKGGLLVEELEAMGIPVTIMNKREGLDLTIVPKLVRWLREEKINVVHTHLFTADLWARMAARVAGVDAIFSTSHSENNWKGAIHRFLDRRLATVSNAVIACTEQVQDVLINRDGIDPKKITVVSNGINLDRFSSAAIADLSPFGVPNGHTSIAIVGRYHPVKGHLYFLDIFAQLRRKYNVSLLLVGEGAMRSPIEEKVEALGLKADVCLCGFRSDIPDILNAIDILVLPSELEGLPMVVLEAMARAKPVVAHDVGGIADVISDQSLGTVVASNDSVAMFDAIARLLDNPALCREIGSAAKSLIYNKFDASETAAAYETLYEQHLRK